MNTFLKCILILLEIAIVITSAVPINQISILLLGDSLTIGYTQHKKPYHPYKIQMEKDFVRSSIQTDIVVNGLSGDRVVDGRFERRLQESINKQGLKGKKFDWVIILGGTNDCFNGYNASRIFSALQNLYTISEESGAQILALTIIDFNNSKFEPARIDTNNLISEYAAKNLTDKVILYDLANDLFKNETEKTAYYQPDGIHLTDLGYDHMGDLIFEAIIKNE